MFVRSSREHEMFDEFRAAAESFSPRAVFGFFVYGLFLSLFLVTRESTFWSLTSITLIVSLHLAMLCSIFSFLCSYSGSSLAKFT